MRRLAWGWSALVAIVSLPVLFVLWILFCAAMNIQYVDRAGNITPIAKPFAWFVFGIAVTLDILVNLFLATPAYLWVPQPTDWRDWKAWTLSARVGRYIKEGAESWRYLPSLGLARNFLDHYDIVNGRHVD